MTPDPLPVPISAGDALPAGRLPRLRLVLLALLAGAWVLPWLGDENGPDRTGAVGALALAAAWGLAATALLAKTRRQLAIGEAATSCAVATLMTWLVVSRHPWLSGPDQRASWVPIFGPLAALSALDLVVRITRPSAGIEVTVIRAGAAIVAGFSLIVALQGVPAGVALWVGLAPVAVHWPKTARGAVRGREALALLAAAALFLFQGMPFPGHNASDASAEVRTLWSYVYFGLAFVLMSFAMSSFLARELNKPAPVPPVA